MPTPSDIASLPYYNIAAIHERDMAYMAYNTYKNRNSCLNIICTFFKKFLKEIWYFAKKKNYFMSAIFFASSGPWFMKIVVFYEFSAVEGFSFAEEDKESVPIGQSDKGKWYSYI